MYSNSIALLGPNCEKKIKKPIVLIFLVLFSFSLSVTVAAQEEIQGTGKISSDILGERGRFYHAFLSLYGAYGDNIFNTSEDTTSDFVVAVAPGIELAFPATRQKPLSVDSSTTLPGGLVYDRFQESSINRFQSYLSYSPRFQFYADNSDENTVNHYGQASLQYNLRGGLHFDLMDRFVQDYDRYQANISTQTDTYRSNLFSLAVSYELNEKTLFRVDYSNFLVFYTDEKNEGRNRTDHSASGYVFYKIRSKTAVFAEYNVIDIAYDNDSIRDSLEQQFWAGVYWNITDKTRGSFKSGYSLRAFDDPEFDDADGFVFEANLDYQFTPITSIGLRGYHRNEETPDLSAEYMVTTSGGFIYRQQLIDRLNFDFNLRYRNEDYQGGIYNVEGRTDRVFSVEPALKYAFREWLSAVLSYEYLKRDSDSPINDFTSNIVILRITGAI